MKGSCQSSPIHINGLPEDIGAKILTHLPIQDAVRTSILSKKWRYAWTKLPHLVFDDNFCSKSIKNTKSKLIQAIYQVLLRHHGHLDKFELTLSSLESCSDIDLFILVVLKAGVKQFTLCQKDYRLPSLIFAYEQFVSLDIRSCLFVPPPEFKGFSMLSDLYLVEVGINGSTLSSLISNCPLLESLLFQSSTNCGHVDIDTSRLKWFTFWGLCESICFVNAPKLETVKISTYGGEKKDVLEEIKASKQLKLSGNLPVVEDLKLGYFYLEGITADRAPRSLLEDLRRLKTLELSVGFGIYDEVFCALCLVKNSKKLEKLKIDVYEYNKTDLNLLEVEGFQDITLDHLREVDLDRISDSKSELQFIELILARSPVLKKFIIEPDSELADEKGWSFFKQVSKFRRASTLVEISYRD